MNDDAYDETVACRFLPVDEMSTARLFIISPADMAGLLRGASSVRSGEPRRAANTPLGPAGCSQARHTSPSSTAARMLAASTHLTLTTNNTGTDEAEEQQRDMYTRHSGQARAVMCERSSAAAAAAASSRGASGGGSDSQRSRSGRGTAKLASLPRPSFIRNSATPSLLSTHPIKLVSDRLINHLAIRSIQVLYGKRSIAVSHCCN